MRDIPERPERIPVAVEMREGAAPLRQTAKLERRTKLEEEPKNGSDRFWKLGGRTWKTVAACFVSLLADSARPGAMPFYAAITAVFCLQKSVHDSFEVAVNREVATIVGGLLGMCFLYVEEWAGGFSSAIFHYAVLSLALIPVISISVWLGRPKSTFLMCVVFLSVTIVHEVDIQPFSYAVNRIMDTTIGIGAALAINDLPGRIGRACKKKSGRCEEDDADGTGKNR